jgi:hypothetical protein
MKGASLSIVTWHALSHEQAVEWLTSSIKFADANASIDEALIGCSELAH